MANLTYTIRSTTSHQGNLFGGEELYDYTPISLFNPDHSIVFTLAMLSQLWEVSRQVLVNALTSTTPPGPRDGPGTRPPQQPAPDSTAS